jgi:hypothetical protein
MLRITVHDGSEFRLKLEGRLSGPWVTELEHCCHTASSTAARKQLVIDLTDLESADIAGRSLLKLLHKHGAAFIATTLTMRQLVCEITGRMEPQSAAVPNTEEN